jgi:catechol 2,3-dioxygenase-like lactoylglutathione lyase family enzyme
VPRSFYTRWFGFGVVFEADWIVVLSGTFLTLQVEDATSEYERVRAAGLECALELTDEPWGQRRFAAADPAGMWVDVVEQIDPAAGWWDRYLQPSDRHEGPLP